ncbi:aspartokinase [Clostridium polyendosporum]|uniref:Aspartokinase n=1 Tax=Clostridium polyendosporum TaxID=69208 RepID=A0A919RYH4_9CLOT|nr:aspartate kinase [Clostridium polyendosporum]GIM28597.1 aspartokinase [Clostridium polyendosporum]
MKTIVQKYGGSSVATTEKILKVADTLIKRKKEDNRIVVVVSAMGDTTDDLIGLTKQISKNPDKREMDALLATGEMISASLLSMALIEKGYDAVSYTAYQIGIKTTGLYGRSLIDDIDVSRVEKSLSEGKIVIVAGFQGVNEDGDITTLGRGGSDTSAVALAVKLQGECEIYTDVDGIYSCDPRKFKEAKKLEFIDYEEMLELASLGAQVMHSRSVELAQKYNIPIYVGLSCSDIKGTIIKGVKDMNLESKSVTGLATCDEDISITVKNLPSNINILSDLFERVARKKINIDMISQTAPLGEKVNVSFTIPHSDLDECLDILRDFTIEDNIHIDENITKFSLVGLGMKNTTGVAASLFRIFSEAQIEVKMITTSEIRITCAIKNDDKIKAIDLAAKQFNL